MSRWTPLSHDGGRREAMSDRWLADGEGVRDPVSPPAGAGLSCVHSQWAAGNGPGHRSRVCRQCGAARQPACGLWAAKSRVGAGRGVRLYFVSIHRGAAGPGWVYRGRMSGPSGARSHMVRTLPACPRSRSLGNGAVMVHSSCVCVLFTFVRSLTTSSDDRSESWCWLIVQIFMQE